VGLYAFRLIGGDGGGSEAIACFIALALYVFFGGEMLTKTCNRATNNELRKAIRRSLDDLADNPESQTHDENAPTSEYITDEDGHDG
jgi:hypothetical protein